MSGYSGGWWAALVLIGVLCLANAACARIQNPAFTADPAAGSFPVTTFAVVPF
jgi:hypothetical protein